MGDPVDRIERQRTLRLEGMPAVLQPRRPEDFDLLYEGMPP
jgi:hypothetical protein